jgi:hypothetical protein
MSRYRMCCREPLFGQKLTTLVGLVSGIVLSKSCQLPKIASQVPGEVHPDGRTKQFSRWVNNEAITFDLYFLPFLESLLAKLAATRPLGLVMDGSTVARGCVTLMVSVLYTGRVLPLVWLVIDGAKGHFPAETHVTLLREVRTRIPAGATVILLGDGEFDSPEWQAEATGYGRDYVCRTAKNIQISAGRFLLYGIQFIATRHDRSQKKLAANENPPD